MKILIMNAHLLHADEQIDMHDEGSRLFSQFLRKRLKIRIKGRCVLYLGKEDAKYVQIRFRTEKKIVYKNGKIWKWT